MKVNSIKVGNMTVYNWLGRMDADCGEILHYHPFANQFLEKDKFLAISLNIERCLTDIIDTLLD